MHVIGTAGHVDHGKSTLVQALTGTHPDRLKEEQEREMTIDLGFAWLTLPDGEETGIVDVPGHRDFIENMLAGVGSLDAALFVVAADEGVMPQTREHLAILDLLQINGGVVALTKTDLVDDPEWLDLVEDDLRTVLAGTILADAPVLRVSAKTGQGLPELLTALAECLADRPPRPDWGRPRLPIDRVFTIAGFGTVVTGTLTDGHFRVGEEIEILPQSVRGRIRGLQAHKQKENTAMPGSRTAINISGVGLEEAPRGSWVAHPDAYPPTRRLDVQFRTLTDVSAPLKHNTEVKFFIGAAEVVGRVRVLGVDAFQPGQTGWLQIELRAPVVALRGDHYILRRPSPGETLGGGVVVDPHPKGRHKRFSAPVLERLEALAGGTPEDILYQALLALGTAPLREVAARSALETEDAANAISLLRTAGMLVSLEPGELHPSSAVLVTSKPGWEAVARQVTETLASYHRTNPLRRGMPREELKSRLRTNTRVFNASVQQLAADNLLEEAGALVWAAGHKIKFSPTQEQAIKRLMARYAKTPFSPPSVKEAQQTVGADVFVALADLALVTPVSADVAYRKEDFAHLLDETKAYIQKNEGITVAQFRDHFKTSRKYALAFLEYLDSEGITVRKGDVRVVRTQEFVGTRRNS